jgi:hypothetical protein
LRGLQYLHRPFNYPASTYENWGSAEKERERQTDRQRDTQRETERKEGRKEGKKRTERGTISYPALLLCSHSQPPTEHPRHHAKPQ